MQESIVLVWELLAKSRPSLDFPRPFQNVMKQYSKMFLSLKGSSAELQRHLAERNVEHSIMVQSKMEENQFDIDVMQGANTQMQQRQQILEKHVANQRAELRTLREELATLRAMSEQREAAALKNLKERMKKLEEQVACYVRREGQGIRHEGRRVDHGV